MKKIYIENPIISYEMMLQMIDSLVKEYPGRITTCLLGKTCFGYPICEYKIGRGNKQVVILGATHGNELITGYFVMEFLTTLVKEYDSLYELLSSYTFHIIPVLNIEGYLISSSNVIANTKHLSKEQVETLAKKYLTVYNEDDEFARQGIQREKGFYQILHSSLSNIENPKLRNSIACILKEDRLPVSVLPIWAANGCGVDPNSNSIHCFCEMKALRAKQKVGPLRYNDIPVTRPSPISYPGLATFDHCPENYYLFRLIESLACSKVKGEKLVAIFSYHATGGEIYGYPSNVWCQPQKLKRYELAMGVYEKITGYTIINETLKYGVMDYYRATLSDAIAFTIELSKKNGNPIGPLADITSLQEEILNNKEAVFATLINTFGI